MSRHYDDIRRRFMRRRGFLKHAGLVAAASVLPLGIGCASAGRSQGFKPLPGPLSTDHAISDGYRVETLLAWCDGLDGRPASQFPLSAEAQSEAFGCNNDFIAYTPIRGSDRGFLGINHEYPNGHLMFPGYDSEEDVKAKLSPEYVACEMAAVGHSVVEIERVDGDWQLVKNSPYARRIHANTPIQIDGPAAGHALLRTSADPSGKRVLGTVGCCSGGKTPWGTVLIAEENVGDFFVNGHLAETGGNALVKTEQEDVYQRWGALDPRFDLQQEPNELNRFGWIVEYDPRRPDLPPVKHTALGRFEHEGATVTVRPGEPLVIYSGDDSEHEFVYRYVSDEDYQGAGSDTRTLLAHGTLYCAKFADDGGGQWLPLRHGEGPLTADNGFPDQASVLINARRAGRLLGATPMDRPEGIAISPTGGVYLALTQNDEKIGINAANPEELNLFGHILEISPPIERDTVRHWDDRFQWDILLEGGQPLLGGAYNGWMSNPDNLNFDRAGRLWIATDGMADFGLPEGLWFTPVEGPDRGRVGRFFACPRGAEPCSPEFTPDGETLFVSIQHPGGEDGSHFRSPSTRWPDFDPARPPRSAVLAITREGGGLIGA